MNSQAVDMWTMRPGHEGALRGPCAPGAAVACQDRTAFDHMPTASHHD